MHRLVHHNNGETPSSETDFRNWRVTITDSIFYNNEEVKMVVHVYRRASGLGWKIM